LPDRLKNGEKKIGVNESKKAIRAGKVRTCFVAEDADDRVKEPVFALCREANIEVKLVSSMQTLGEACGIRVGSAVAVLLK